VIEGGERILGDLFVAWPVFDSKNAVFYLLRFNGGPGPCGKRYYHHAR